MSADIQSLVASLQDALGIRIACGQITLNINNSMLDSFETKTKGRIVSGAQKAANARHVHDFYYDMATRSLVCSCGERRAS